MKYTKEQLQGMSDFEINKTLGQIIYPEAMIVKSIFHGELISILGKDFAKTMIDYCNNPNDIMPLAFEHKIGLYWGELNCLAVEYNFKKDDLDCHAIEGKNPLRAIACCLILVLQDKGDL